LSLLILTACVTTSSRPVEESGYFPIGGIDQWVTLRGSNARNPVLLLLHGGPGDVQSPFVSVYAPYTKDL
jgi:hypothetical protein